MTSHYLVTGGSGFLGSHIIAALLARGANVTASVRSQASGDKVRQTHHDDTRLAVQIVDNPTSPDAYRLALQQVTAVIHTASPFVLDVSDPQAELLQPAVQGTTALLRGVAEYAPQVKHVVITSSLAAVQDMSLGARPGYTYTEADWNPISWEDAVGGPGPVAYAASKTFAEKAGVEFEQHHRPPFTLTRLCPPMIYGPLLAVGKAADLNTSAQDIFRFMDGSASEPGATMVPAFADVRDVAEAHIRAVELGKGGRFLVSDGPFQYRDVCAALQGLGWAELQVPAPDKTDAAEAFTVDSSRAKRELGLTFRGLDTCIRDMATSLRPLL